MAKDFLKRLLASSNVAYIQALQGISVALQSAHAHPISVAREFLTLDGYLILLVLYRKYLPSRLVVPRLYAVNPLLPARPLIDIVQ